MSEEQIEEEALSEEELDNDLRCFTNILNIEINEDFVYFYRCCYFSAHKENTLRIPTENIPLDPTTLKTLVLTISKTKPNTFRDLKRPNEKHCKVPCSKAYSGNVEQVFFRLSGCNLKCKMCNAWEKSFPSKKEVSVYKAFIDALKDDYRIFTTNSGEPFLYKKIIFDALKGGVKEMVSISNLTLLNDSDIEFLKDYQENYRITSSIDSTTEEIYLKMRYPATHKMFLKVLSNFEKLASYGLLAENNVTITQQNLDFDDLEKTLLWAEELGVSTRFGVEYGNAKLLSDPIVLALKEKYPTSWRT